MKDRQLAFHTKEKKDYRIPNSYHGYQFKLPTTEGKDPEEIMEELQSKTQLRDLCSYNQIGRKMRREAERLNRLHGYTSHNKSLTASDSYLQGIKRREPTLVHDCNRLAFQKKKVVHNNSFEKPRIQRSNIRRF